MQIVYILKSLQDPTKHYVGITKDLNNRLSIHNSQSTGYTRKYAPWKVETSVSFNNESLAFEFEKYLKRGSGHAFLKKHLV